MRKLVVSTITLCLTAAEALAQAAPPLPSVSGGGLLQMLLGVAGILALLIGSLWLLKKLTLQRGSAAGLMRVVAATAVGGRERVVIVEVGSTWLVLGVAPGRVTALAEIPRQPLATPPAAAEAMPGWLQGLMRKP
ncbi:MAG: flagellar biosynthetic protein FliO [Sulfuritalea sp.]|nr:flagellar biosynthetic protein FliO [Sulfuritalea sp.]MDP3512003.1 flagellar biosynthetic protein FliO [Sulfuritalea sp.]